MTIILKQNKNTQDLYIDEKDLKEDFMDYKWNLIIQDIKEIISNLDVIIKFIELHKSMKLSNWILLSFEKEEFEEDEYNCLNKLILKIEKNKLEEYLFIFFSRDSESIIWYDKTEDVQIRFWVKKVQRITYDYI